MSRVGEVMVHSDGKEMLAAAIRLAFVRAGCKAAVYHGWVGLDRWGHWQRSAEPTNIIAVYSAAPAGMATEHLTPLLSPHSPEQLAEVLHVWLENAERLRDEESGYVEHGDGSNEKGFKLEAGDGKGWDWQRIFTITPAWTYYGK